MTQQNEGAQPQRKHAQKGEGRKPQGTAKQSAGKQANDREASQQKHETPTTGASPQESNDKPSNRHRRSGRQTRSFRFEKLEKERPSLTRDGDSASKATRASRNHSNKSRGSKGKGSKSSAELKVIPLGGLDAIGKNMTVFECGNDMIIDDAGLMFPDDDHPGIDLILPDYTYVLENANKLRGIVITHGHEDHTGSLPYLYKDLDNPVPIYASKLTLGLIEGKFKEHRIRNAKLVEVKPGDKINLGCFEVEFFAVNHSIPGALGIFLRSPAGNVLHTGDFKLDQTPIDGVMTDFGALSRFSSEGVDLMLSDSTNAMKREFTPSEREVGKSLESIIAQAKNRVIIASFASHIHRMQQICDAAVANGRKVVVTGRSMIQNTDIARKLGYLHINDDDLVDAYELSEIPPDKIVVMCTGSQGEPLSALSRIAGGLHKTIDIEEGDTVIISATPVPGNEKAVTRVINLLSKIGADVYDKSRALVHVSGHAGAEELKLVLSIVQPDSFMPVHGEAAHLRAHAKLAEETGVAPENIFILENGETLTLSHKGAKTGEPVQSGVVYVDGLSVGDTSQDVLDERITLGAQGFAVLSAAVNRSKRTLAAPLSLEMHGITGGDDPYVANQACGLVENALKKQLAKGASESELRKVARDTLLNFLWETTKQRPMTIATVLEV